MTSAVERAIQEVKGCMSRMVTDDSGLTGAEALLLAIGAIIAVIIINRRRH